MLMAYLARNISANYAILLKQQVPPGGVIDLAESFLGFCKPKKSSKAEIPKYSEFSEEQFPEFLLWVEEMADRRTWILEFNELSPSGGKLSKQAVDGSPKRKSVRRQQTMTTKVSQKKASSTELVPKEIALLPYTDATKKLILDCSDIRKIKLALKLARNLAGQEKVRGLLEDRVSELATEGIV